MKTGRRAFTLVELMVSMTILILVLGCVLSVLLAINRSLYGLSDAVALNGRTRIIQERIALDLRSITKLTAIGSQSFSGSYLDYATGTENTITYAFTGGKLTRSINGGTAAPVMDDLVTDVTTASHCFFQYSNRLGALSAYTTTNKNEVRAIKFDLVPEQTARQKRKLVHGSSDPFCSPLFQLRNRQS